MAKRIKLISKKILFRILKILGLSSFFSFTGCVLLQNLLVKPFVCMYGVPENHISGIVFGDIDKDGNTEPIPNIQYKFSTDEQLFLYTEEDGYYYGFVPLGTNSVEIEFTDVDGEENGSFKSKTVTIDFTKTQDEENYNITLDNDN